MGMRGLRRSTHNRGHSKQNRQDLEHLEMLSAFCRISSYSNVLRILKQVLAWIIVYLKVINKDKMLV